MKQDEHENQKEGALAANALFACSKEKLLNEDRNCECNFVINKTSDRQIPFARHQGRMLSLGRRGRRWTTCMGMPDVWVLPMLSSVLIEVCNAETRVLLSKGVG